MVPVTERLASIVGFLALLLGSGANLSEMATLSPLSPRDWLVGLYAVSVLGLGITLVFGLTRQHYSLAATDRPGGVTQRWRRASGPGGPSG